MALHDHVILVAFDVLAETRHKAQVLLMERMTGVRGPFHLTANHPLVDSWWIAEDDRADGSDSDSAVFVEPGRKGHAAAVLHALEITARHNLVPEGEREAIVRWDIAGQVGADSNDEVPTGAVYADALTRLKNIASKWASGEPVEEYDRMTVQSVIALLDGDVAGSLAVEIPDPPCQVCGIEWEDHGQITEGSRCDV